MIPHRGISNHRGECCFSGILLSESDLRSKSRETLIKAFPAPDLRREAAHSFANPCASAGGSKEVLI
jgi:hypothetical protein